MDPLPALESFAYRQVAKLENICAHIERCEVAIESVQQHQRPGKRVHVRVTVVVRGPEPDIVVSDGRALDVPDDDQVPCSDHDDAYLAVRDAVRAARRCFELVARRDFQSDHISSHP